MNTSESQKEIEEAERLFLKYDKELTTAKINAMEADLEKTKAYDKYYRAVDNLTILKRRKKELLN